MGAESARGWRFASPSACVPIKRPTSPGAALALCAPPPADGSCAQHSRADPAESTGITLSWGHNAREPLICTGISSDAATGSSQSHSRERLPFNAVYLYVLDTLAPEWGHLLAGGGLFL